jgi:hypothetical protein
MKALHTGDYSGWSGSTEQVFGFIRKKGREEILVILNMSDSPATTEGIGGEVLYSTHPEVEWIGENGITLAPHQGVVVRRSVH